MDNWTDMGGAEGRFRTTRISAIDAACSNEREKRTLGFSVLATLYWKPVYKYIRIKWDKTSEDAQDLTQGFFAAAIEKGFFRSYDPQKARFRTFLRTCVDRFVSNQDKFEGRIKRGGREIILSLDFESAEGELAHEAISSQETVEAYFNREWVRNLFAVAVEALRTECEATGRSIHYQLFEAYDLDGVGVGKQSYEELAGHFGIPVTQVTNYLAFARREFRRTVKDQLRQITATEEEYRRELRALLGMEPA